MGDMNDLPAWMLILEKSAQWATSLQAPPGGFGSTSSSQALLLPSELLMCISD